MAATQDLEGYKPVIHRGCGGQIAWVKEHMQSGDRMIIEEMKFTGGSFIRSDGSFHFTCDQCEETIHNPMQMTI